MSSSSVWVQLYYNKGKDEPEGRPTSVKKPNDPLIVVAPAQKQQQRLEFCRTWSSEGNHLPYNLLAKSYDDLQRQIQGDSDLEEFIQISNTPAVLAWERGSDGSPTGFPGEIAAPFSGSNVSSISTSTLGHIQKVFQAALLVRDKRKCVVSGTQYREGSGNVQAAHIIPVAAKKRVLEQAKICSIYDTCNGMLLESTLHKAFDSYLWCLNENGVFCVSDAERHQKKIKEYGIAKYRSNVLDLSGDNFPTKATLRARHALFQSKVDKAKNQGNKKS
ncbi:expressed unknown protein [Seminavis robusta]|uniref:HNH nuclease domain-containing protein n=1 Tax=Seminavis robusta TaxID=568900 RepID=A0A9N8DSF0_9STRA|nr:expressed unknown protein [Seminavis robusta]|eukprot:Sro217_g089940.1 n/a (275) ;mRNA; r:87574-88656